MAGVGANGRRVASAQTCFVSELLGPLGPLDVQSVGWGGDFRHFHLAVGFVNDLREDRHKKIVKKLSK